MSRDAVLLLVVVLALVAFGLVMLYSATGVTAENSPRYQDGGYFLKKQLLWTGLSVLALAAGALIPYGEWARWRVPVLGATFVLLGLVFFPGIGAELNAARRWIRAGSWFMQPSEFAKIGIAVFLAAFAAAHPERLRRFLPGFVPASLALGAVCGLVLVEPDVGTAFFIALVMTLLLVVAGIRLVHLVPAALASGAVLSVALVAKMPHVLARLETYLHPESDPLGKGHQITQSLVALGSGGWTGLGLGRGISKLYFLPEAHSDFLFSVIGEELGFLGAVGMILLYAALGVAGYRIMRRAPDRFGFLLSFSITTYIILQAAMNVAVVTAAIPTKGIPLPFVSAGGSSLIATMAGVGMLISVANAAEREPCREGDRASCSPEAAPAAISSRA